MYQECFMRVIERLLIHLYSWYNFNPKGIIIFPGDDKQIILLYTSMRNNNPELQYTGKKKIPKHNTIWEK